MDLKMIMEQDAREELERDGAACVEVMQRDLVAVVRCRDCAVPHNRWLGCPMLNGLVTDPDFFCANGERKEER